MPFFKIRRLDLSLIADNMLWFVTLCHFSSDLIGLLNTQRFSKPTSTTDSSFGNAGFYQNKVKNAGETITYKSRNKAVLESIMSIK